MNDNIDIQTANLQDEARENEAARGAEYTSEGNVSLLAYVMSSAGSSGVQTTFKVRICEMMNTETEGAMFAGDFNNAESSPRELLATNVGTARPGVSDGSNPGTLVLVHKVGDRFAFDYNGG